MDRKSFEYDLPKELIAQTPIKDRDHSRLYFINRKDNLEKHLVFSDILDIIPSNAILVINNTKVISARMHGIKEDTGAKLEIFYLNHYKNKLTALVKPKKRLKLGTKVLIGDKLILETETIEDESVNFKANLSDKDLLNEIEKFGEVPLPPYIKTSLDDASRYQTVYANKLESSAAPTAGLHFTVDLLNKLKEKGVTILDISLKIGLGTFKPITEDNILNHKMHYEEYEISKSVADTLNKAIKEKREIIAVGTTVVRTLEGNFKEFGFIKEGSYKTNLFIYPGFRFNVINHLITNFHLPSSSLLCLVSAFHNQEAIINHYKNAVKLKYRFFSFGDAMLLW